MGNREHNDAGRPETFNRYRGRLFSAAYGMLGGVADAEDVVQDAYLRWQGLTDEQLRRVRSPEDYLAVVVVRLSLDRLRSAKARREEYVGSWLPEPLLGQSESGETGMVAQEALSVAMMVLLECLTPIERAVFLLREVFGYGYDEVSRIVGKSEANCRQIARRAKASVDARRPRFEPSKEQQEHLLWSFIRAASEGDMEGLLSLLAEDVAFYTDGGGKVSAARNPVYGRDRVIRFVLGILDKRRGRQASGIPPRFSVRRAWINGGPGLVGYVDALPVGVLTLEVSGASARASIRSIYMVLNPEKLSEMPRLPEKDPKVG